MTLPIPRIGQYIAGLRCHAYVTDIQETVIIDGETRVLVSLQNWEGRKLRDRWCVVRGDGLLAIKCVSAKVTE